MAKTRRHHPRARLWDRRIRQLSSGQRSKKEKFLHALSLARRKRMSLDKSLVELGIDENEVLRNTDAVRMRNGKLVPKVRDRIPRSLRFYEKGKLQHAEVANSEVASDIGRYWNAIADLTEKRQSTTLRRFPRKRFKDIKGRFHTLERELKVILELEVRKPKPETFEIYKR